MSDGYSEIWTANNALTPWFLVGDNEGVGISGKGNFSSGTIAVEQLVLGSFSDYLDADDVAIGFTASFNRVLSGLRTGDVVRLRVTGATTPTLVVTITGTIARVED